MRPEEPRYGAYDGSYWSHLVGQRKAFEVELARALYRAGAEPTLDEALKQAKKIVEDALTAGGPDEA